jgi:chromosome partitioning protein
MRTVAVISHKGGAGKTSSSVMLAEDLAARGQRVVLIDADRQRGAGLLLGLDQPNQSVQQTQHSRLRYFCCAGVPLRELPAKSEELSGLFDVAVVDTPSLDDPLARAWIQLSTAALMLIPVEPVSLKTLEGAESALEGAKRLNPSIQLLGVLPTMFNAEDSNQRTLLLELKARSPDTVLSEPIPHDLELAQRAAQAPSKKAQPAEATRRAYHLAADHILRVLDETAEYEPAAAHAVEQPPVAQPASEARAKPTPTPEPAPTGPAPTLIRLPPAPAAKPTRSLSPVVIVAAVLVLALLALGISMLLRTNRSGKIPNPQNGHRYAIAHPGQARVGGSDLER